MDGNGQRALAEALAGVRSASGAVRWRGAPRALGQIRTGYVPEDRQTDGIAPGMSLGENLLVAQRRFSRRRGREAAEEAIARHDIRATGPDALAGSLSGGNAQKLVLARALSGEPELLVVVNPTRGLDLGARAAIHRELRDAARRGIPVVLLTSDLDELFELGTRTAFLSRGRLREGRDPALMAGWPD